MCASTKDTDKMLMCTVEKCYDITFILKMGKSELGAFSSQKWFLEMGKHFKSEATPLQPGQIWAHMNRGGGVLTC